MIKVDHSLNATCSARVIALFDQFVLWSEVAVSFASVVDVWCDDSGKGSGRSTSCDR